MTKTTIASEVHQTFDAHCHFTTQIALDGELTDLIAQTIHLGFRQVFHFRGTYNPDSITNFLCAAATNAVNRG
ncbi:MAG: hypothetical protein H6R17_3464 [Proteobacteria bacterium]|nr:hypothetical protein [Pseudomonadota bacterium]